MNGIEKCVDCGKTIYLYSWDKDAICPDCKLAKRLRDDENYSEEDRTVLERLIYCPWCGNYYEPDFYDGFTTKEETCDECGKKFLIEADVEVRYSTNRVIV